MAKKSFFRERTAAEIKRLKRVEVRDVCELIEASESLKNEQFVQVMTDMFPRRFSARSFNKYGPITKLESFESVKRCLDTNLHHWELLRNAVNKMQEPTLGFATIPPAIGLDGKPLQTDLRPLVYGWKEIFEGHRLFAYSHQRENPIIIERAYGGNPAFQGLTLVGTVPSRREKIDRHKLTLWHVPATPVTARTPEGIAKVQHYLSLIVRPSEVSEKRRYLALRSSFPGLSTQDVLPGVWLDVALYDEYIRQDSEEMRQKKLQEYPASIEFTPFPMVTQFGVDIYKMLLNQTLNKNGKKLRDAELNLGIGEATRRYKHGRMFFSQRARDGRIQDYDWTVK